MTRVNLYPSRQADFVVWMDNLATTLAVAPATYGASTAQAAIVTAANTALQSAYATWLDPATSTRGALLAKNVAIAHCKVEAKRIADIVRAFPSITPTLLNNLGIPLPAQRTPNPPPGYAPGLTIVSVTGRTVRVRLRDMQSPDSRGKPPGCLGAMVMSAVSPTQPDNIDAFRIEGIATRNVFDVVFPDDVADGAKVWLVALWNSTRGMNGPVCTPVGTNLAGGTVNVVESLKITPKKKAA